MKRHVVGACILLGLFHTSTLISAATPGTAKSTVIYEQHKLTAADGQSPDRFGHALDVSGSFALIGAAPDDVPADRPEREAAYVFERVGDGWIERRRLAPPNDGQVRDFGRAVAIDGDTAVVGAPREAGANGPRAGAVHIYVRNAGEWTLQARLVAPDGGGNDRFGAAVAAEGNVIVVGAPWAQVEAAGGAGAAYVFVRQGSTWSAMARLTAPAGFSGDEFGFAVAVSGDAVLIGAPDAGPQPASQNGLAYVFARQGDSWAIDQTLVAPDAANGSLFGHAVALDGDRALVGAYAANGNALRSGAAYVFRREAGRWQFEQAMAPDSAQQGAWLGDSVALDGHQALIGAPGDVFQSGNSRGSAYAYIRAGQRWGVQSRLLASDGMGSTGFFGDSFGAAVALDAGRRLASSPWASIEGRWAQGAAYGFAPASPYALSVSEIRVPRSGMREAQIALAGDPVRGASFQLCADGAQLTVGTAMVPAGLAGLSCVTSSQGCPGSLPAGLRCSGSAAGTDWVLPQQIRVPLSVANGSASGSTALRLLGDASFATSTGGITPVLIDGRAEVARYAVGGQLSGLEPGKLIRLRNTTNNSTLMLAANGAFALPVLAAAGNSYNVQIQTAPREQSCLIVDGAGTVAEADVEQIRVRCFPGDFGLTATAPATMQRGQTATVSVRMQAAGVATGRFDLCVDSARLTLGSATVPGGLSGLNCAGGPQCPAGNAGLRCSGTASGGTWNLPQTISIPLTARTDAILGNTSIRIQNVALADGAGAALPVPITNANVQISGLLRVGGRVTGLTAGAQVVLRNTSINESLTVGANGIFAFNNLQPAGTTFDVRVIVQPSGQVCRVTGESGTLTDRDVTSILVSCETAQHALSVTAAEMPPGGSTLAVINLSGASVAGLAFQFCFDRRVAATSPPPVGGLANLSCGTVGNSCPLQAGIRCSLFAASGTLSTPLDIPITLTALPNVSLGSSLLSLRQVTIADFEGNDLPHSTTDGTLLIRTPDAFPVGGTLSGLASGRTLRLTNAATGEQLTLGNGNWVFPTWQRTGQGYQVSASAQPIGQLCTVSNPSGTIGSGPVDNISVTCPAPAIFSSLPATGSLLDFGDVVLGSTAERTVALQNSASVGAMPLQLSQCTISGGDGFSIRQIGFPATIAASGTLPLQLEFRSQRYTAAPRTARLRCSTESAGAVVEAEWPLRVRVLPEIFASGFGD